MHESTPPQRWGERTVSRRLVSRKLRMPACAATPDPATPLTFQPRTRASAPLLELESPVGLPRRASTSLAAVSPTSFIQDARLIRRRSPRLLFRCVYCGELSATDHIRSGGVVQCGNSSQPARTKVSIWLLQLLFFSGSSCQSTVRVTAESAGGAGVHQPDQWGYSILG